GGRGTLQCAGIFHDQPEPFRSWRRPEVECAEADNPAQAPQEGEVDDSGRMIHTSQGRLPDRRPLSIIDIGSNSIRLVVYEGIARSPTVLFNEKMLAGLGRGIVSTGRLDEEAVHRAVDEFRRFRALSDQAGAQELHVIATAAAREAEN